jgi:uncharacterized protein (TIGR02246 family)
MLSQKLDEAYNKNDAAAVAALFTQDALLVTPDGMFSGRQDIEKGMKTRSSGGLLPILTTAASAVT